jgi:hypothetical protein
MQIGPDQGQFLGFLAHLLEVRRAIEVGVFTGYGALSVALALPEDGYLLACDVREPWTNVGKPFWAAAGVAAKIDLRLGPAVVTLDAELAAGAAASFDVAFIDADKSGRPARRAPAGTGHSGRMALRRRAAGRPAHLLGSTPARAAHRRDRPPGFHGARSRRGEGAVRRARRRLHPCAARRNRERGGCSASTPTVPRYFDAGETT